MKTKATPAYSVFNVLLAIFLCAILVGCQKQQKGWIRPAGAPPEESETASRGDQDEDRSGDDDGDVRDESDEDEVDPPRRPSTAARTAQDTSQDEPQQASRERPEDLAQWTPEDFASARLEEDDRLAEAVAMLGERS